MFLGGLFLTVPVVGHVVVLGHLAAVAMPAIETAVVVGGLCALCSVFLIGATLAYLAIIDKHILYRTTVGRSS